jgi:hypothetical protein
MIRKLAFAFCLMAPLAVPTPAHAQDKNPSFTLLNKSSQPIRELFVTPAGDANWGQNRLTAGPVAPGSSFASRRKIDGNCVFDLRVVYADNTREDRRTVNTCNAEDIAFSGAAKAATAAPTKPSEEAGFRLTNHNKQAITELYATPKGEPRGGNLLEKGALPPDASMALKPAGKGCNFEINVIFADKTAKNRTTDLCKVKDITVP